MPWLHVGGGTIYYEVHGSGRALIFAHGLGGNHLSWWQQVPHFRERYTCVTFAHRGFWPSTDAPNGPGPAAFVDDLAALIDHLGLGDVRLVAQSMGGWTCLGYALREPARVRALVMADTTGSLDHPEVARLRAQAGRTSDGLFARGVHPAAGARMALEQPALHVLYQQINDLAAGVDKTVLRRALTELCVTPPEQVAALPMPVLCIAGEDDVVIPPAAVEIFAALVPDARLVRVPAAGHSVYFERAAVFNSLVDRFLIEAGA
jgi:3-oxoadipate enol-lactonase